MARKIVKVEIVIRKARSFFGEDSKVAIVSFDNGSKQTLSEEGDAVIVEDDTPPPTPQPKA